MKLIATFAILACAAALGAQTPKPASTSQPDPLAPLAFLEGGWAVDAKGDTGARAAGNYLFARELNGHILARHGAYVFCVGPQDFDCGHQDLLYVYAEGSALKAIFLDNEGHVIHYDVSAPDATTAVFLSDASTPGPRYRLSYSLKNGIMTGNFQMLLPGKTEWRDYLTWSGPKQKILKK